MDIWHWVVALTALTGLEIILGIDNIIFLTILASRLPPKEQPFARRMGLLAALVTRLGLLFAVNWLMGLKEPLFEIPALAPVLTEPKDISTKDLILIVGGLFLVGKSVMEIHHKLEGGEDEEHGSARTYSNFWMVVGQIAVIDIVFSLDSVITAVGMARDFWLIATAMIITIFIMLLASEPVARMVESHPTLKILGLSFLILIGFLLVAEGFHQEIQRGYIYFTMAFALGVEALNIRIRPGSKVKLHGPHLPPEGQSQPQEKHALPEVELKHGSEKKPPSESVPSDAPRSPHGG